MSIFFSFFFNTILVKYWLAPARMTLTDCDLVMPYIDIGLSDSVNIGLGNDLAPEGTKPLPEPMLTYYNQLGPVTLIWRQFHKRYLSCQ